MRRQVPVSPPRYLMLLIWPQPLPSNDQSSFRWKTGRCQRFYGMRTPCSATAEPAPWNMVGLAAGMSKAGTGRVFFRFTQKEGSARRTIGNIRGSAPMRVWQPEACKRHQEHTASDPLLYGASNGSIAIIIGARTEVSAISGACSCASFVSKTAAHVISALDRDQSIPMAPAQNTNAPSESSSTARPRLATGPM